ncbi:MAG: portal protein, partial [Haloferula sp.]
MNRRQGPLEKPVVVADGAGLPQVHGPGEAKENRTGVSKASAGLNAEALQSTTSAAVSATMSGAQGRVELICRHFADGMKDLFKLVNSLVIKHQEGQDMMRLNNEFIPIDPRYWDADKDMVINVGISKN